ncbi:hypothetical protein B7R74_17215 [Yersinia pseudotuberculosis]|nr:hypothetical protein [Yersinia pseudotuberculosis]PSH16059.1 hypothetical protein B7R74_17215 [Yersinia pseudotuberculosis]CND03054.1 Uncharacterised protein [Yersinia pseudotuberculosis]
MHRMRRHKMRMCGLLLIACWLTLNAQLAIASHPCDISPSAPAVFTQHQGHLQHQGGMSSSMNMSHDQTQDALCEKHCIPDSVNADNGVLVLAALPTNTELVQVDVQHTPDIPPLDWHTPPIIGPPTEIALCRFRE